jgi:hypothetical protein
MLHDRSIFPSRDADTDREHHTASPTAHLLDELALYGYRFGQDEPDPRPLPEPDASAALPLAAWYLATGRSSRLLRSMPRRTSQNPGAS